MKRLQALRNSPMATLVVVAVAIFTDLLLYSLVVPILPGYAATLGVSQAAIGLLFGSYAVTLLVATPLFGVLSDRVGRRGPMVWGLFGLGAATLLFASASDFRWLVAARLLQGLAAAATWTAGLALIADVFPPKARGKAMGTAMASMAVGTILGPPFGGLLSEWGGYRLPFLVAAVLALLDGLARLLLLAEPPRRSAERSALPDLLRDRVVLATAATVALGAGAMSLLEPTLPLHLQQQLRVSPGVIGLLFGVATFAYGISSPLAGALADRWGRRRIMAVGLATMACTLPLLALPRSILLEAGVLTVVAVACGLTLTPALPELADAVDRRGGGAYASVYAIFNTAYALGMLGGPVAGGLLADTCGFAVALAITGLALLFALLALSVGTCRRPLARLARASTAGTAPGPSNEARQLR